MTGSRPRPASRCSCSSSTLFRSHLAGGHRPEVPLLPGVCARLHRHGRVRFPPFGAAAAVVAAAFQHSPVQSSAVALRDMLQLWIDVLTYLPCAATGLLSSPCRLLYSPSIPRSTACSSNPLNCLAAASTPSPS